MVTLMLVLTMAVSVLAIPAAATSDLVHDCSVEPRYPMAPCACGGTYRGLLQSDGRWKMICDTCGDIYYR